MSRERIYLSPPHLSGRENHYLEEVLQSNWIAPAGPHLAKFEKEVSQYVGVGNALAVSSGTAALHLLLLGLDLKPDDKVICSTLTFCASANPILYQGAKPVFVDSDTISWNMDPNLLEEELTDCARQNKMPRAVIVVDIFGQSADIDPIIEITSQYDIPVIEDAAEALGATYRGKPVGSRVFASFFSFNGNKILTTSGGGMICSNHLEVVERAGFLAEQAKDPAPHFQHSSLGYNYRMSNVLAAIGLAQMEVLEDRVEALRRNFDFYHSHLSKLPGISFMPEANFGKSNRWLTVLQVEETLFESSCEEIRLQLEKQNIESRPVWKPLHLQPLFQRYRCRGGAVAEKLFRQGLCLPSGSSMTEEDLLRVVSVIEQMSFSQKSAPVRFRPHAA